MNLKSLLTTSLLGVISAAVSSVAYANDHSSTFCKPGFYAGIQGGRSDTFYNGKNFVQTAASTSNTTYSQQTIGPIHINTTTTTTTSESLGSQKVDDIGISGRIYAGYQFNPYFALETGYTQYAKTSFSVNSMPVNDVDTNVVGDGETIHTNDKTTATYSHSGEISENAVDLVGKATLPLNHGFGLYAKAGASYINANRSINSTVSAYNITLDNVDSHIPNSIKTLGTKTTHSNFYQALRPTAGIGANYSIPNSNISLDASYSRVFSSGAIPQASLLALGAEYKFS